MSLNHYPFSFWGGVGKAKALSILRGFPACGWDRLLLIWLASLCLARPVAAQWVQVDPNFPTGSGPDETARTVAVQSDGRVLIGGLFTNISGVRSPYIARINTNGTIDTTFAAQLNGEPTRIQPMLDGRILISGAFTNVNGLVYPGVARLLADGVPDTGFVPPRMVGAASQLIGLAGPGGEVWVTGSFTNLGGVPCNRIARLLETGALDPGFRSPFAAADSVTVLALQADGKAIVSGSFSNVLGQAVAPLVRLNADGTLDQTFQSGLDPQERIFRALLLPDGRLLAAVAVVADFDFPRTPQRLVRLQPNGALDPGFSVIFDFPGFPFSGAVCALALQADGKLLVSGTFLRVNGQSRGKIARLTLEGQLDECFEVALGAELTPLAVAPGLDGSVILAGSFAGLQGQWHPYLLRLQPAAPCAPGVIEMAVSTLAAREDALRVVVPVVRHGGTDLDQTVEYSTRDGSAQSGADYEAVSGTLHFAPGERSQFISIPLRPDGMVEGPETFDVRLTQAGGGASLGALTNVTVTVTDAPAGTAGAPDTNYVVQLDGPVQRILPLADGRAVIAGSFTNVNGQLCPNLARLLADGTRDPSFVVRTQGLDGEVYAMALDSAGRLLVAGYFQRVDGVWRPGLARFGTDGTLDMAFRPFEGWPTNSYSGVTMQSVAVLADGSIVCGGEAPEDNDYTRDVLLKLSPAGEVDGAFTNRMPPSLRASELSALPDGDVLLFGGGFGGSLTRLHPDGSINFNFLPPADRQSTYYYRGNLSMLPDGRVMVGTGPNTLYGLTSLVPLWRLNPDGSLDSGFSASNAIPSLGILQWVYALSLAADGRVLVAGAFSKGDNYALTLRRLQADGSVDWSFDPGTGLKATAASGSVYLNALAALPGSGWLLGGDFASYNGFNQRHLVKVLPEALTQPLVFSFNVTNAAVMVRETNTVLTFEIRRGGDASSPASVTVRTADGTATAGQDYQPVDTTLNFGIGEWSKTIRVTLLDDRLVESTEQFTLCLTNATSGFSLVSPSAVTVSIQNDDAAVEFTASQYQGVEEDGFALVAVKWSGALTTNLQATVNIVPQIGSSTDLGVSSLLVQYGVGTYTGTNWLRIPIVDNAQHQTTRQFRLELTGSGNVVAGARSNAVLLLEDRDFTTTPARGVAGVVEAMANAPGNGVYVVGDFTGVHGEARNRVARLLPDGEVDPGFDPGVGPNADVSAVAMQPDGKVLIAGSFTAVAGVRRAGLARLQPDGSLDGTFDPGVSAQKTNGTPFIRVLLPQSDGGVLVGGAFTHFNNRYSRLLARLESNGRVSTGFTSPFTEPIGAWPRPITPDSSVLYALVAQPDGKLLAGGILNLSVAPYQFSVVRLDANGQLDTSFTKGTATVRSLVLTEGKILVGGSAWTNWVPIQRLGTNGTADASFRIRGAPSQAFASSEIRQLLVQPDGRILFCAAIYMPNSRTPPDPLRTTVLDRAVIGRLLADGTWDSSFHPLTCSLTWLQQLGPFWFNDDPGAWRSSAGVQPLVPTASVAQQPDGVLVVGGAFDAVNGEPRRRLARVEADGALRGRLALRLTGGTPLKLLLPGEVEAPYIIETSADLSHWSSWLANDYPWWPVELSLPPNEPGRFFRAQTAP